MGRPYPMTRNFNIGPGYIFVLLPRRTSQGGHPPGTVPPIGGDIEAGRR